MNFINKLAKNDRSTTLTDKKTLEIFGINANGVNVNSETAMKHTTVYACVNVKAQGLSSVPFTLYEENEDGGRDKAKNHPLFNILGKQANPLMTSQTWREMVVQDIELRGTHFSQIVRNRGGEIVALYPLAFDCMTVELTVNSSNIPTLKFTYNINGKETIFSNDKILRIVGLPSSNGILGVTPIGQNAQSIGLGVQTETFGSKFFENGANGSGILSTDKSMSDTESIDRLATQFGTKYQGLANSKKPIVLEDGMKWQPITISNNDSQFLETRTFQKGEIASIFRVSPHLINEMSSATFSNITELSLEHVKYCLMPVAIKIEASIWSQLLTPSEQKKYYSEFNFNGLLRGDFKTRTEGYKNAINAGYMTPNEARRLENMNKNDDAGDKLIINNSYASLEEVESKELNPTTEGTTNATD